ncbi:MAG: ribbon-helix-helix domain-containing protein [Thermoplasmata archaeon]|nr:ribbon-helix-helix domain-containing protein [Thermoplasmata archaeon]
MFKYLQDANSLSVVFDNAPSDAARRSREPAQDRRTLEEERIALRCTLKELQLLDSFVASGEFRSRSELMRAALRDFLRVRAALVAPPLDSPNPTDLIEVPVRLRASEVETFRDFASQVANGRELGDVLADLVRRGELELKVSELVERARHFRREDARTRERLGNLARSSEDLERRGVVGR